MIVACLILIVSTGLFAFYVQTTCQKILGQQFGQEYFQAIVNANRLEFPAVQKAIEEFDAPVEYPRYCTALRCDYLVLTYLLKNAANVKRRYSRDEWFLMLYFRGILWVLPCRHLLRRQERLGFLKLISVLQYFANVIGRRVSQVRFGNLSPSDYLMNL